MVLFDEVEKADPDIWQVLLQIGEGRLSDATGRTVSFADTTVIVTANIGAAQATRRAIGFGEPGRDAGAVMAAAVTGTFAPELLGRIDASLVFHRLPAGANVDIARRTWSDYQIRMRDLGWSLHLDRSTLCRAVGQVRLDAKGHVNSNGDRVRRPRRSQRAVARPVPGASRLEQDRLGSRGRFRFARWGRRACRQLSAGIRVAPVGSGSRPPPPFPSGPDVSTPRTAEDG